MTRLLPLVLALACAATAAAQAPVVLTNTADRVPTRVTSEKEPPTRRLHERRRSSAMQAQPRADVLTPLPPPGEIVDVANAGPLSMARYTVRATVPTARLDAALVRLAEDPALVSIEAATQDDLGRIEATFAFGSVAEWVDWKATADARAPLENLQTTLRAQ